MNRILGITTEYTPYMVEKSAFLPFVASSAIEAGNRYIPEVRATGEFEDYFNEPLAAAKETWKMTLARESKLGNFLADCLRFGGQTELAYMNATSAGGMIEPGVVTRESITEVNGFNDLIHVGQMTGKQLYELMELVYEPDRFGNNAALLISGFHAELDYTQLSPHKVVSLSLPDGTEIDPERLYLDPQIDLIDFVRTRIFSILKDIRFKNHIQQHRLIEPSPRHLRLLTGYHHVWHCNIDLSTFLTAGGELPALTKLIFAPSCESRHNL
jgi:hypothetical protein